MASTSTEFAAREAANRPARRRWLLIHPEAGTSGAEPRVRWFSAAIRRSRRPRATLTIRQRDGRITAHLTARNDRPGGPAIERIGLRAEILVAGSLARPWFPLGELELDQPGVPSPREAGGREPIRATADITDVLDHAHPVTVRLIVSADTADGKRHRSILSAVLPHDLRSAGL